jgi:uncharacterized SAM-binding protein YcdF (DUF218 family)
VSDFVHFVFSIGGLLCALLAGGAWAIARPSSRAARRVLAVIVMFYVVASFQLVAHAAKALLSRRYHPLQAADVPPGRSAVVILGSGSFMAHDWSENGVAQNDAVGADRVIEAVRVFKLIQPEWIVSSGGAVGSMDPKAPGGKVMKDLLLQLGVPESRILLELESKNTRDEAVIVRQMLGPLRVDHVVLVTSDTHMWRSVGTFRAVGLDVIPAIARSPEMQPPWNITFLPSSSGLGEMQTVFHEALGTGYYALRGWYR